MQSSPLLSIVVPVYGVAGYLRYCLDSILDQAGAGVEVVAVNDCSPDGSGEILDSYGRADPRVQVLHLATNVGLGRARNIGLARARGTYVWFVDADDWLPTGALPAVAERLRRTRPDVLLLDHVEVHPDGSTVGTSAGPMLRQVAEPAPVTRHPHLLALPLATSACTKVIRRELLHEIGLRFPPGWYEDCAFTFPLLLAAARVDAVDRVGYCYRQRPAGAITKSRSERHLDIFVQYDRMWARVEQAAPGNEQLRPQLFRLMLDHLLVVAGNDRRLPGRCRREYFRRLVAQYRRRRPAGGYRVPGGLAGWKHLLVRHDAYRVYAVLRLVWRVWRVWRDGIRPARPGGAAVPRRRWLPRSRRSAAPQPTSAGWAPLDKSRKNPISSHIS